jgi:hypothetical protein
MKIQTNLKAGAINIRDHSLAEAFGAAPGKDTGGQ